MQGEEPPRLHAPPPSAAAPKPKGILKNAQSHSSGNVPTIGPAEGLQWDETNLTLHEIERENMAARMKVDEPKTPFVRGTSLGPDDIGDDSECELSYCSSPASGSVSGSRTGSRRSSAADLTKANTAANARTGSLTPAVGDASGGLGIKVPSDIGGDGDSEMAAAPPGGSRRRSSSCRSSSARPDAGEAADSTRNGLRRERDDREIVNGHGAALADGDEEAFDSSEGEEDVDEETKEKHDAFAAKRKGHYGNEAEALKAAKLLAQQDDEDDEDDDDDESSLPPLAVPPLPANINGGQ
ncbi:hypothetical protein K437DRAFT_278550 [Tilletiaria anomala UBC 951]|uniref:Uncharacterized protein n=1 Tax=Tilletiaria anomala (strain ATCC 24038 / CBS 436.72 / UBC 951) TaxID=1037660 RepID=A0A066W2B1_TILAU|nr:uncharacterized protein K437DRAFT_278550 [Tilletiaria anomala UBC 951]KDN44900.1 hypothetical protein K437DRAFT_278550 [Tilletiaria anomala UBC 951]